MSELKLQCAVVPKTDYLICRNCKDENEVLANLVITNEGLDDCAVVLTKEDARILADKLYSIVKGE